MDGRMAAEVIRVLASDHPAGDDSYPRTLFAAGEAFAGSCTSKATIYAASGAAGLVVGQFARWLRGVPVVSDQTLNLLAAELTVADCVALKVIVREPAGVCLPSARFVHGASHADAWQSQAGKSPDLGVGLPSGTAMICRGMTPTCRRHCYAVRLERYRPAARYRANLALSKTKGFARRVQAFLVAHHVQVVRVHAGGKFYSATYARKWLAVMHRSRCVRFYLYSRAWRLPAIKAVVDAMATRPNVRVWYSCDRDTGLPADVPPNVRLAWLMTEPEDRPPPACHLVFRVRQLRADPNAVAGGVPVCPAEVAPLPTTCDRCGVCWRPLPATAAHRVSLPVVVTNGDVV